VALFLPLKFVVPLILLLDFTASIVIGGLNFKRVNWDEIGVLIPFGVGVVLGTSLLVNLPPEPMLIALPVCLVFALRSLFNITARNRSLAAGVPAALTGGTVGALFAPAGRPT